MIKKGQRIMIKTDAGTVLGTIDDVFDLNSNIVDGIDNGIITKVMHGDPDSIKTKEVIDKLYKK